MGLFDIFKKKESKKEKELKFRGEPEFQFIMALPPNDYEALVKLNEENRYDRKLLSKIASEIYNMDNMENSYLKEGLFERQEFEKYYDVIKNTTDEKTLSDIAINTKSPRIYSLAVAKIDNNEILRDCIIKYKIDNLSPVYKAIDKIDDFEILMEVCKKEKGPEHAINYILDKMTQDQLMDIAKNRTIYYQTRLYAIRRINDKEFLTNLYNSTEFNDVREEINDLREKSNNARAKGNKMRDIEETIHLYRASIYSTPERKIKGEKLELCLYIYFSLDDLN